MIKYRRMRWARHVARTGEGDKRVNMNGRNHLGFLSVAGRIILKWIIKKSVGKASAELFCLRMGRIVDLGKAVMNIRVT